MFFIYVSDLAVLSIIAVQTFIDYSVIHDATVFCVSCGREYQCPGKSGLGAVNNFR